MNRGSSMQNGLIDSVTFTCECDLLTPKAYHFKYIPKSFPILSVITSGSFVFELCCGQTDKQTDGLERPTHAGVSKNDVCVGDGGCSGHGGGGEEPRGRRGETL